MKKKSATPHISVVIPVYGCRDALPELCSRLIDSLDAITPSHEIILVNDACPQNSWDAITDISNTDRRIKGINLARNFGQHYAITAGLDHARGEWVVVMDCDLQDQPEEIKKLYARACEGYDVVVGRRVDRKDGLLKRLLSSFFGLVFKFFTGIEYDNTIGNFGIYSRAVIANVNTLREQFRSFGLFAIWVGFKRSTIDIEHAKRSYGRSSYSLVKQLQLAIGSIVSFSNKLLNLVILFGFILSFFSFMFGIWLIIRYYLWSIPVTGWTSLIVSLYLLSGLILGSIGVVGIYIGNILKEVKARPLYVIKETTDTMTL